MEPFAKHPAELAELDECRRALLELAEAASRLTTSTGHAYQPAIEHWDGLGAAELMEAQGPLRQDSRVGSRALAWAAVTVGYWAREVRAFNSTVDRIMGDDPYFGAATVDGVPPVMESVAAARHHAERRWWEAYNTHILDGEDRVEAMLRNGPTEEHLHEASRLGLLPPHDLVPEWHDQLGLSDEELDWINGSVVVIGDQLIVAPSPAELDAALAAADQEYRGWRPSWLAGPDSPIVDPDHYHAKVVNSVCSANPEWCGWEPGALGVPVYEEMGLPLGRVAATAAKNSFKGLLKQAQLPHRGGFRYVPPRKLNGGRLPEVKLSGGRTGYKDRDGNIWVAGPSRTRGEPFEWDVQLRNPIKWRMPDGATRVVNHMNVSLEGRITHVAKR